ncbi:hypothetical protein H634G_00249 [Metarhizium anisopliae BRIP 53293]|uniref:Uncharacterized protein n=1 Tax=Metarhizium anisopliae BRIP 53293 TaxID=1291518 RepID=A0A0D9PCT5_METAN|nr:hypothetical protein H634G_00249 [Metarhizium anisopliae BRIP 53293]KJK86803.1 hypothetical protein H633G_09328 [Metarhizium anisopliae BRIP 53284]
MQYPLLLVAAFATASIAASIAALAAGPPASTQGKEDVAKGVGKLAEEACPRDQLVYNGAVHNHVDYVGIGATAKEAKWEDVRQKAVYEDDYFYIIMRLGNQNG